MPYPTRRSRTRTLLVAFAALASMAIGISAAHAEGAQVIHYDEVPCTVSWSDSNPSFASDCSGKNTKTPNGGYTLVLHGQIPADDLAEFSGPTSYATGCAANYFFWREGIDTDFVFTDSVRHFTADGAMTEVCNYHS